MTLAVLPLVLSAGCGFFGASGDPDTKPTDVAASVTLTSPAFPDGSGIPTDFTCKGAGVSPPLAWSGVDASARSLAIVVTDPDASSRGFTHWVLFDIDPKTRSIATDTVPPGARQAKNSAGKAAWSGPCPPSGTHHYVFTIYVLRSPTTLPDGADTDPVLRAITGKAVAKGVMTGTFSAG